MRCFTARRRIGREAEALPHAGRAGGGSTPDRPAALIDRAPVEARLKDVHAGAKGAPALSRALLIAVRNHLSDGEPTDVLDQHASFRRLCGCPAHETVSEPTSFVRFRRAPVERGLDAALFDGVNRQATIRSRLDRADAAEARLRAVGHSDYPESASQAFATNVIIPSTNGMMAIRVAPMKVL